MKLVMVAPYPVDSNKINGGVEAATLNLIEELKQLSDLEIQIISCRADVSQPRIMENNGVVIHFLPASKRFANITLGIIDRYHIRRRIAQLKPDIIHFQNHIKYAYVGFKYEPPCSTVTTLHGIIYEDVMFDSGILNRIRRFPKVYMEKICLNRTNNSIICVSPYAMEVAHQLSQAKTYFVPNPISNKFYDIQNCEVTNRILCVAPISNLKNQLDLIKAINLIKPEIPTIKLHLGGEIRDNNYYLSLESYIKAHGLEKNVEYLGHLSEEKLIKEYGECCILAHSSFHENSPMAIQQAMAARKAVVATPVGGVPYLVDDSETGFLVQCGDINELARKIKLLLVNKKLREKFGENAKHKALEKFKADVIAQKTYEVYYKILNNN